MGILGGLLAGVSKEVTTHVNQQEKAQIDANAQVDARYREQFNGINPELALFHAKNQDEIQTTIAKQQAYSQAADTLDKHVNGGSPSNFLSGKQTTPNNISVSPGAQFQLGNPNQDIGNSNSSAPSLSESVASNNSSGLFGNQSAGYGGYLPPQVANAGLSANGATINNLLMSPLVDKTSNPDSSLTNIPIHTTDLPPIGQPSSQGSGVSLSTAQPVASQVAQQTIPPSSYALAQEARQKALNLQNTGMGSQNPAVENKIKGYTMQAEMYEKQHDEEQKQLANNSKPLEGPDKQAVAEYGEKAYAESSKPGGTNPNTLYNPVIGGKPQERALTSAHDPNMPGDGDARQQDLHIFRTMASPLLQTTVAAQKGTGTANIKSVTSSAYDEVNSQVNNMLTIASPKATSDDVTAAKASLNEFTTRTFGNQQQINARYSNDPNFKEVMDTFTSIMVRKTEAGSVSTETKTDTTKAQYDTLPKGSTYTVNGTTYTKK